MKTTIYKIMALISLGLAIALGIIVLHFSLTKAQIIVIANQTPVNIQKEIQIPIKTENIKETKPEDLSDTESRISYMRKIILSLENNNKEEKDIKNAENKLHAYIRTKDVSISYSFDLKGKGEKIAGRAEGLVTIYNEMSFNQPLVANTRLLSPQGVLFRTKKRIAVPAGGSVDVEVYADKKGESGNIEPTTFTIPGLSPARQKLVYAKSFQPFSGGIIIVKVVTEDDINKTQEKGKNLLKEKAVEEFNKELANISSKDIFLKDLSFNIDAKPGDKKNKINIKASAKAYVLIFNKDYLLKKAETLLSQSIPEDKTIIGYNEESFYYEIINIDELLGIAKIKVYLEGSSTLKEGNSLITPINLVGLSADDIQERFLENESVQEVIVKFSPFWVQRAPRIPDKIKIIIKSPKEQGSKNSPKLDLK